MTGTDQIAAKAGGVSPPASRSPRGLVPRTLSWLLRRPAWQYMVADGPVLDQQDPPRFARAWIGLLGVSLLWGLAMAALYAACWRIFGDFTGLPLIPAAAVLAGTMLGLYRRSLVNLAGLLGRDRPAESAIAAAVIVVVWAMVLLGLRSWNDDSPYNAILATIRPPALFRALLLAPLWGGWAMLATCQFRAAKPSPQPVTAALAQGTGVLAAPTVLAVLLVLTIVYFNHLPWTQLSISAVSVIVAVGSGLLAVRLEGALTRRALLSANLLTQLAFLLAYLANR